MTLDELLPQLIGVRRRGARWSAHCPAHADKSPSLSVSEGDKGLLLRCWAGCELSEITAALGLEIKDLFFDTATTHRRHPAPSPVKIDRVALAFRYELAALDLRLRAARIIEAGKQLDLDSLNDQELDRAMNAMAKAHADEERAELFEHVADTLRERDFCERKSREQSTRVA